MQQIFWASEVGEMKVLLKLGLLGHKRHQPLTWKAFLKVWSGLCLLSAKKQHSSSAVCGFLLGIIPRDKRQAHQASSVLPREEGYSFELAVVWFAPFFE